MLEFLDSCCGIRDPFWGSLGWIAVIAVPLLYGYMIYCGFGWYYHFCGQKVWIFDERCPKCGRELPQ